MWLTDPTFPSLVEDSWKASAMLPSASSSYLDSRNALIS